MKHIFETFTPQNIYNADETAIYFSALPESTYVEAEKKKSHRGFKTAKDRVTVLVTCNINGAKEKLLLIGKFKSPRCFKRIENLPITYDFSKNAWNTRTIFNGWLKSWDKRLQTEQRKVALLVDNFSSVQFSFISAPPHEQNNKMLRSLCVVKDGVRKRKKQQNELTL